MTYTCPVCGYPDLDEEPRDSAGFTSFEICPCCGFQFGVSDDDRGYTYEQWRARWTANGMHWSSSSAGTPAPAGWDPQRQLAALLDGGA